MPLILIDSHIPTSISNVAITASQKIAQSFSGSNRTLAAFNFYIKRGGASGLSGTFNAKLYNHTGSYGHTGKPTGTSLEDSTSFLNVANLTDDYAAYTFNFSNTYPIMYGTPYTMVLDFINGTTSGNVPIFAYKAGNPHGSGNYSGYTDGIWTSVDSALKFQVYGSTIFDILTYSPYTPINALPEPTDQISWDWMEITSQYSQRFNRMATFDNIAVNTNATYVLDYSSLGCECFPPIIKVYEKYGTMATLSPNYYKITGIDLSTATFTNLDTNGTFLFRAYI